MKKNLTLWENVVADPDHEYKFHCNACNLDLSSATGGSIDIKKHMETESHNNEIHNFK